MVAIGFRFYSAVKTGQYDDDYTPSVRMLLTMNSNRKSNQYKQQKKTNLIMEMQQFYYDNKIVKAIYATILFGVVGMLVGLILAFMFLFPNLTEEFRGPFGRLRPLHAVIFAVGNAMFAEFIIHYSGY